MKSMLHAVVLVVLIFSKAENETLSSSGNAMQSSEGMVTNARVGESCIMEALSAIRSQATATNIYLQEVRKTLEVYEKRLDEVDDKLKLLAMVDDRLDDLEMSLKVNTDKTNDQIANVQAVVEDVKAVVEANGVMAATIKTRQKTVLSEVRLISMYKMTNQSTSYQNFMSESAVDGQLDTFTHTLHEPNQKLWIDLGALFRINRVLVWNRKDCCKEKIIGTHIYADERLLGVVTTTKATYEYKVSTNDPVYARSVILHQIRDDILHVGEVQVWGTGPFAEDDRFN